MRFDRDNFFRMINFGWVIDARAGGIVLGRSHKNGNIYMIEEINTDHFTECGNLEGGEYILNHKAANIVRDRLDEINDFKSTHIDLPKIELNEKTRVLNTHAIPNDKYLWIDFRGQYIINKFSTALFFDELEDINNRYNDFLHCDFTEIKKL